jgi:hypothetical protein
MWLSSKGLRLIAWRHPGEVGRSWMRVPDPAPRSRRVSLIPPLIPPRAHGLQPGGGVANARVAICPGTGSPVSDRQKPVGVRDYF